MKRVNIAERKHWQDIVEYAGFDFHTDDSVPYWNEGAAYVFAKKEAVKIKSVTRQLWKMYLQALEYVIDNRLYDNFYIPSFFVDYLERSWRQKQPSLYGRFDLVYKDGKIKLLEFNGDTPASLLESAMVQDRWLYDHDKSKKQVNQLSEKMIATWTKIKSGLRSPVVHFACLRNSKEDISTTEYIKGCAQAAGIYTRQVYMDEIGWHHSKRIFVDNDNRPIKNIFKFFPYEWLVHSDFGQNIVTDENQTQWIEPAWKMILSSKALLPVLWKLFPGHENLLPCYFDAAGLTSYARKPFLCRQGEQIELSDNGVVIEKTGDVPGDHCIYQELYQLPQYDGYRPLIGSWIVGDQPAGIGIRESVTLITDKKSMFVPHYIE